MNPAADQVMDLIFGRWRSQTLFAGTELGVFDLLDTRSAKSPDTLAAELGADPNLLYRLLRAQAAIGLLEEDGSRGFVLTDKGDLLRSDHPQSLKPMARLEEGPQHYALWKHLPAMVQDGKQNAFVREFSRMAFEYALENRDYAERFKQAMASYSAVQSTLALEALRGYDFSGIATFCDVAGGYGHLMCAMLLANPGLGGIVLDLPEVVEDVHELWAMKLGLQQRCRYVAGDMFEAVPKADAYSSQDDPSRLERRGVHRDPVEHPRGGNRAGTGLHCRAHRPRARRAAFL
jgi:O-methyltransferase domain/Dimerisation domain